MSVRFWTGNARGLLYAFEQAVYIGDIATWSQNADRDFTHKSEHLKNKALLRPKVYSDSLAFAIIQVEDIEVTGQLYGMFQACIIQSFLTHLSARFTLADASSSFRDRDGDLNPSNGGAHTILSPQRADFFRLRERPEPGHRLPAREAKCGSAFGLTAQDAADRAYANAGASSNP